MIRTQLQLDEKTYEEVRRIAHQKRESMSAVVRDILHEHLQITRGENRINLSFIGAGSSGRSDISVRHDEALTEDYR